MSFSGPDPRVTISTSAHQQISKSTHCIGRVFCWEACMAPLKRTLNLAQVTFFGVGVILGAGIYTIIGKSAGLGGNLLWVSFLIAAITAAFTAFSYAELSAMYPTAGGEFTYLEKAAGSFMSYAVGFIVVISGVISAATIALGFAGYFSDLVNTHYLFSALGIIGLMLIINIVGVRQTAIVTLIFTLIEGGGLIYVIIAAWDRIGSISYVEPPSAGIGGILVAASLSFFAFKGYENIVKLGEETLKPERNIPRAIFLSSLIVFILYMLVVIAAISAVPYAELAESESPLSTIVANRFGHTGAVIIGIVALFSTSNTLLSGLLGASRVVYTMSRESGRLKIFSRVSGKHKTPVAALVLCAIFAGAFVLPGNLKNAAMLTNFFVFITAILVNLAVLLLRAKKKNEKRPYRIPGNIGNIPVITVFAILLMLLLAIVNVYGLTSDSFDQ